MSGDLIIAGGRLIDPQSGLDEVRDICISGGYIKPAPRVKNSACPVFDARGMIVVPGLIDLHVHFREPGAEYKEDIASGSRAAARGGFTTVCCMPNTLPVVDNRESVKYVQDKSKEAGPLNLLVVGALSKGQEGRELADYEGMLQAGICALSDDGKSLMDAGLMRRAAETAKLLGLFITDHAENHSLSMGGIINEGAVSRKLAVPGIPNKAEADIVARDIELVRELGCHIHFQHISTKESLALIRAAKRQGLPVSAETAPHYFALTEDAVLQSGTNAKMNPPLRSEGDRLAVIEAIQDGTIDAIATDHAPHSPNEKAQPLDKAPFGIVGLETAFALSYTSLLMPGYITLNKLITLMCLKPAKILNLKTGLDYGSPADLAVFDISNPYLIDSSQFLSKARNTPFDGMEVYGRTLLTICGGDISWEDKK